MARNTKKCTFTLEERDFLLKVLNDEPVGSFESHLLKERISNKLWRKRKSQAQRDAEASMEARAARRDPETGTFR